MTLAAVLFFGTSALAQKPTPTPTASPVMPTAKNSQKLETGGRLENYQDIILKAQNLTLQRDRLQASQVLLRALEREPKNSLAHKDLLKNLDQLTSVFYTERAQGAYTAGESLIATKPREALDSLQEALRLEDGNTSALKSLARTHLILDECDRAESYVKSAEALNPYSAEVKLLRLQALACSKATILPLKLADPDLEPFKKYMRGFEIRDLIKKNDMKKAKAALTAWEAADPDYPELHYWKWELSKLSKSPDRAAAARYSQLCQNLSARKRKSYTLDVDLCKGKEAAELFLKETAIQPSETL